MAKAARKIDPRDAAAREFIDSFGEFITAHFGPRCHARAEDCAICEMWDHYDAVRELSDVDG